MGDRTVSKFKGLNQLFKDMGFSVGSTPVHAELVATTEVNPDGSLSVPATGVTQPTGGSGALGWLSGIYATLKLLLTGLDAATDVTSATISGSVTSAIITPAVYSGVYSVTYDVTAISGTSPTIDVVVQESDDGVNWFDVFHFERITAVGSYRSSVTPYRGNYIRYISTIGGTGVSVTRSIKRYTKKSPNDGFKRRFYHRGLDPNVQNSSTPWYDVEGCNNFEAEAYFTNAGTTNASLRISLSNDGVRPCFNSAGVAINLTNGMVALTSVSGRMPKYVRVNTLTAATGTPAVVDHIAIKAWKQ